MESGNLGIETCRPGCLEHACCGSMGSFFPAPSLDVSYSKDIINSSFLTKDIHKVGVWVLAKREAGRGEWLAQLVEHIPLDFGVVSSRPMLA